MLVKGFDPIAGRDARVVILGTLPGAESLQRGEYYADPSNTFWFIMRELFGISGSYDERVQGLIENRIAIWDVLQEAERDGSSDTRIVRGSEVSNDFGAFLGKHSEIKTVFFNGQKAEDIYRKLVILSLNPDVRNIRNIYLTSTSGTNTHYTSDEKVDFWRVVQQALEND